MSIEIIKQQLVKEDMELGLGTVVQQRADATGALKDFTYNKVNSDAIPHTATTTVKDALDNTHTKTHVDTELAKIDTHLSTHDTEIAARYTKSAVDGKLGAKADKSNVLEKNGNTAYTPTNPYSPATMKYVLDTVVHVGAGDMAKSTYDKNDDGIVDNAHALDGTGIDDIFAVRGHSANLDLETSPGSYIQTNKNSFVNMFVTRDGNTTTFIQEAHEGNTGILTESRRGFKTGSAATVWQPWESASTEFVPKKLVVAPHPTNAVVLDMVGDRTYCIEYKDFYSLYITFNPKAALTHTTAISICQIPSITQTAPFMAMSKVVANSNTTIVGYLDYTLYHSSKGMFLNVSGESPKDKLLTVQITLPKGP